MHTLRRADFWFNAALLLVGAAVVALAFHYGIFTRRRPGPGLFPLLAGLLMVVASSAGFLVDGGGGHDGTEPAVRGLAGRLAAFIAVMVCLVIVAEPLGLLISVFAMMVAVGMICAEAPFERRFVLRLVTYSAAFAVACHLFFKLVLRIPLLEGPLAALS